MKKILFILLVSMACEDPASPPPKDCFGVENGTASINECGLCIGGTTNLPDNFGFDECGVCFGDDSSCLDCKGEINGNAQTYSLKIVNNTRYSDNIDSDCVDNGPLTRIFVKVYEYENNSGGNVIGEFQVNSGQTFYYPDQFCGEAEVFLTISGQESVNTNFADGENYLLINNNKQILVIGSSYSESYEQFCGNFTFSVDNY